MISKHLFDDIPPAMKIINMINPILMHFYSFVSQIGALQAA